MVRIMVLVFTLLLCSSVNAKEIAGVDVPEQVQGSDGKMLVLNGAGIRSKFFFKIYIAELYLENKLATVDDVIGNEGAKRMVMHFLYDEVGKEDIVESWVEGFKDNGTENQLKELAGEIESFNTMFDTVKSGDAIVLDYVPGTGTMVSIRDEQKGAVPGKPFNDLLLSIWLGKEPVDEDLRDSLLGK